MSTYFNPFAAGSNAPPNQMPKTAKSNAYERPPNQMLVKDRQIKCLRKTAKSLRCWRSHLWYNVYRVRGGNARSSGNGVAFGAMLLFSVPVLPFLVTLSCTPSQPMSFSRATRCGRWTICLCASYALPTRFLRASYAMSGTNLAHGTTRYDRWTYCQSYRYGPTRSTLAPLVLMCCYVVRVAALY
eukprot:3741328-Rhodomonas_salina.1